MLKKVILASIISVQAPNCHNTIKHTIIKPTQRNLELKCDDAIKIQAHNTEFYACKSDINEELIKKINYVAILKEYAQHQLGLTPTKNYTVYKNNINEKPKTYYRLYITKRYSIPNKTRNAFYYLSTDSRFYKELDKAIILSSDIDTLIDEKQVYNSKGYDTYWRKVINFSDNDGCNLSPLFFNMPKEEQAATLFHEEFHEYVDITIDIEESMAAFVGFKAAIEFTKNYFGEHSNEHLNAKKNMEEWYQYSKFIIKYYNKLNELYQKDLPLEVKLKEKLRIMQESKKEGEQLNNALIWGLLPYTKEFLRYYELYKKVKAKELIKIFKQKEKNN